jgi:prevent-host-death family protein
MKTMKRVPMAEAKAKLHTLVAQGEDHPCMVTSRGKPVALLMPFDDPDDLLSLSMAFSPRLRKIVADAAEEIRQGRGIPEDEFWKLVEADARAKDAKRTRKASKPKVRS